MTEQTAIHMVGPVVCAIRRTIAFNTSGIATGVKLGTLPANFFVTDILVDVQTAFNAGSTNVLTVGGEDDSGYDDIVASGDVDETSATCQRAPAAKCGIVDDEDFDVYVKYAQTGTAASAGVATIVVQGFPYQGR